MTVATPFVGPRDDATGGLAYSSSLTKHADSTGRLTERVGQRRTRSGAEPRPAGVSVLR